MENNIHEGHRQRLREEFLKHGFDENTPSHKILELLLFHCVKQKDTNPLAHALIEKYKTVSGVLDAPIEELVQFSGITENNAILFKLIIPIARIYLYEKRSDNDKFSNLDEIGDFLVERYMGIHDERLSLLGFDSSGKKLFFEFISEGDIASVGVSSRNIIKKLLDAGASCAVISHNHPSNIALPSEADVDVTKSLAKAMESIGINLIEHIVVAGGDYISMRQSRDYCSIFPNVD